MHPIRGQRRLAEPGGGADERNLTAHTAAGVQPLDEARPRDEIGSPQRDVQLGLQQITRHAPIINQFLIRSHLICASAISCSINP